MATILCVGGEDILHGGSCEQLCRAGHEVLKTGDGKEALSMVLRHRPDLVLSDIASERVDGHALMAALRYDYPEFAGLAFIFLYNEPDRQAMADSVWHGAQDCLVKPVDGKALLVAVNAALRHAEIKAGFARAQALRQRHMGTGGESSDSQFAWNNDLAGAGLNRMPASRITLVGACDKGLWQVQRALEGFGHEIRLFTSGRAFIQVAEQEGMRAELVMLWFHTDDMQAPMIQRLAPGSGARYVLVLPETLTGPEIRISPAGFAGRIDMPIAPLLLARRVREWIT